MFDFQFSPMLGICYKCEGKITGSKSGCKAMDNQYHVTCFVCDTCGKS